MKIYSFLGGHHGCDVRQFGGENRAYHSEEPWNNVYLYKEEARAFVELDLFGCGVFYTRFGILKPGFVC